MMFPFSTVTCFRLQSRRTPNAGLIDVNIISEQLFVVVRKLENAQRKLILYLLVCGLLIWGTLLNTIY